MADGVGGVRRRAVLAGVLVVPVLGRAARAQPVVAAPAPPDARPVIRELRLARDILCPRCSDDIERSGVNHPARRSIFGRGALERARDMLAAAPDLPGQVPAMRQVLAGIEALDGQDEEGGAAAITAAIHAIEVEGRVAARGGPPDPRPLIGQLQLARSFLCVRCAEDDWIRGRRARALEEVQVAQAMLAAAPRLRQAPLAGARMATAAQALAAGETRRADAALAQAIDGLRPPPR